MLTEESKTKPIQHFCKRVFGAIGRFARKRKFITAFIAVDICALIAVAVIFGRAPASGNTAVYSFIRTVTLTKGNLDDTVSATGTVESANTSTVSYSAGTGSGNKVAAVNVAVGDSVKAGDVIVTLDTTDILKSIADEKEKLADSLASAQTRFDTADAEYDDAYAALSANWAKPAQRSPRPPRIMTARRPR